MMYRWIVKSLAVLLVLFLAGCAGTIQRESLSGAKKIEGGTYHNVEVVLTDAARRMQGENPQFSVRELSDYVRRRLEAQELLQADGRYRVEVTIESFRVRSAVAAVLLGIMAGTDSIDGYVRVYDSGGRQVHGYKVNASYGLGGWGGGQDGTRMNWMYDKFSELAVAELGGKSDAANVAKGRAVSVKPTSGPTAVSIAPAGNTSTRLEPAATAAPAVTLSPSPAAPTPRTVPVPAAAAQPAMLASGFAAINDVDAIPYLSDKGRDNYREWVARPTPKAFAISSAGHWFGAWSLKPADPTHPTDPAERALHVCGQRAQGAATCKLYAINNSVVWVKEPSAAAASAPAMATVQPVSYTPAAPASPLGVK